ncbi:HutD family protein [Paraburkholderia sp. J7]|uniref:HutD/Ves family protein n=1 Tax=Paraburkholderia sp. J7 TaxID=2805438 RepID=UPI002AB680BC|nr:HutD family protein [Paraburkholderia sp. J7]
MSARDPVPMNTANVRALAALPREAWRNGGGVTRTLAANANADADAWRVSIAEVERDGPYSRFAGMTRVSFVLRGAGVVLREGALEVSLTPNEAVEYTGNAAWDARLVGGAVTVLNVMSAAQKYRVAVRPLGASVTVDAGGVALVLALDGACDIGGGLAGHTRLASGEYATFADVRAPLAIAPATPGARIVLVTLSPVASP